MFFKYFNTSARLKGIISFSLTLLLTGHSHVKSQAWMKYIDPDKTAISLSSKTETDSAVNYSSIHKINLFDVQKAFNKYWENRQVEKGKGYKQFKRWENYFKPRIYPEGYIDQTAMRKAIQEMALDASSDTTYKPVWKYIGPSSTPNIHGTANKSGNGRINCITFHPDDSLTMFVGAPSGGIWKTTDGGQTWVTTTDKLASIGISDIVINYNNPDTMYAATGDCDNYHTYSIGVIKSVDGGDTWTITNLVDDLSENAVMCRLIMHPSNPDIMFVTSTEGIYRTSNGWQTFSKVIEGHFQDIEFKPGLPSVIYAATYDYWGYARVYRSTNTGTTFSEIMEGFSTNNIVNRIELAVTSDNPNRIYALASNAYDDGFYGFFTSTSSGNSWTQTYSYTDRNLLGWRINGRDEGGQGWYDLSLAASPNDDNLVYLGGVNIWGSENAGTSWEIKTFWQHDLPTPYVHADHHMLKFNPHNDAIYSCNDGGLYYSFDGDTWIDVSANLEILQAYRISNSYLDSAVMVIGTQDNGTFIKQDSVYSEIVSGDGMNCIIDYSDTNTIYASVYNGELFRSDDGGKNFNHIVPDNYPQGAWITPFEQHPEIPIILFAGYQDIYETTNKGESWTRISKNLVSGDDYFIVIKVAPSNNGFIYAATDRKIWRTSDNGNNWASIGSSLPDLDITDIEIAENDPNKVWISLSGFDSMSKIYYSEDGGNTWENYSTGLPNIPVNCLEYMHGSNKALFAGTDLGVFFRDDNWNEWKNYTNNLPHVVINELEIHYPTNTLRAGTFGRGIWETVISDTLSPFYYDFYSNILKPCADGEIEFYLLASQSFDSINWDFGTGATINENMGDTLLKVTFNSVGLFTVNMDVYKDSVLYNEQKINYIEASQGISFNIYPDVVVSCVLDTTRLYVDSEFEYTWEPDSLLDHSNSEYLTAYPTEAITYSVTGSHGTCNTNRKVVFSSTPDNVCDALYLSFGNHGPVSNECATVEEGEPIAPEGTGDNQGCNSEDGWCRGDATIENTVWFKTIMPQSGEMSVLTSGFDNQIAIYTAPSCESILENGYELIAANDDFVESFTNAATIKRVEGPSPGDTLWIQVDGGQNGEIGLFFIELSPFFIVDNEEISISRIESLKIYPNPSSGQLFIQLPEFPYDKGTIEIYDTEGKFIDKQETYGMNLNTIELNTHLNAGLYFIRVIIKDKIFTGKVLIE